MRQKMFRQSFQVSKIAASIKKWYLVQENWFTMRVLPITLILFCVSIGDGPSKVKPFCAAMVASAADIRVKIIDNS